MDFIMGGRLLVRLNCVAGDGFGCVTQLVELVLLCLY